MPTIDWDEWSAPEIRPYMAAIIYLPNETINISDDEIVSVNFFEYMFADNCVLFGPPNPGTGQLEIIDYEQRFNPMINPDLMTPNIKIELYLGLWPVSSDTNLGPNIVTSFEQPVYATVDGQYTWATIIHTNDEYLHPLGRYRLEYSFSLADESEIYTEYFYVPGTWFEKHIYAITQDTQYTVYDVKIQEVQSILQPYGTFYAQDWTYSSVTHITNVDLVDGLALLLTQDTSMYSLMPAQNQDSVQFLLSMLPDINISDNVVPTTLLYSTYQETYPKTVNSLVEAIRSSLVVSPDNTMELFRYSWYDTGITLTDHDVTEYILEQSSTALYDSITVEYQKPTLKSEEVIFSEENLAIEDGLEFFYSRANVFDFTHFNCGYTSQIKMMRFILKPVSCIWVKSESISLNNDLTKGTLYGRVIEYSTYAISYGTGSHSYSIVSNNYIQTKEHAEAIVDTLAENIFLPYFTIRVTIRGCYGIWVGGLINVYSEMYGIDNQYIITQVDFDYNGGVRTTLTLQRRH